MSKLEKDNFYALARYFHDCGTVRLAIERCTTTEELVEFINDCDDDITEHLEDFSHTEYIRVPAEYETEKVVEWLSCQKLARWEIYEYLAAIDETGMMRTIKSMDSLIAQMKMELLLDMIDDVSLGELEQLHAKYKGGGVDAGQMRVAL